VNMCEKYYELSISCISFKKLHLVKVGAFLLDTASKFALFSLSGFKDKMLIKQQTYMKSETCKLYSSVF